MRWKYGLVSGFIISDADDTCVEAAFICGDITCQEVCDSDALLFFFIGSFFVVVGLVDVFGT